MTDAAIVALLAIVALAVLLIEGVVLWARRDRGLALRQWFPFVLAGAGLLLALLASALGLQWQVVAIALAVAGLAHAADLIGRWPRG